MDFNYIPFCTSANNYLEIATWVTVVDRKLPGKENI